MSEPDSQPGDYWLSLPVDVSTAERTDDPSSIDPEAQTEQAVHDLTDGHGGRAIHARGLRISVGDTHLLDVGTRPDNAVDDEIVIEHSSGASIRIDSDGNIEITTEQNMTFTANKITMNVNDKVEVVQ